jgi:soluble lytic murein transglycosylase-like protein
MQITPVTASYLAGNRPPSAFVQRLHDPATNLSVGQSYVLFLAHQEQVAGDFIRLLASYNAGPAGFARMCGDTPPPDDPLLFIESIPNDETRGFVPRPIPGFTRRGCVCRRRAWMSLPPARGPSSIPLRHDRHSQ